MPERDSDLMVPRPTRPATPAAPLLVLDTNVVLDWLVFRDPGCTALVQALTRGQARWGATAAMREELEHVLTRGSLDRWQPDLALVWSSWDRWATLFEPFAAMPAQSPRCSDPEDQKFIDLGLQLGASALLSRDRAVLRCARRVRPFGLEIVTPAAWALD